MNISFPELCWTFVKTKCSQKLTPSHVLGSQCEACKKEVYFQGMWMVTTRSTNFQGYT